MRPAVSVIVPCWNCADTVERTLDSLCAQTLEDLEIVVINDGSTDTTGAVLSAYADAHPERMIRIYEKENEGIAAARTFGVSKVTGRWFGFLDSDDYCDEGMFRDLYDLAEREQLQVAVSHFLWHNSQGERLEKEGPYPCGPDMMVSLFAVLWNKLYNTDFIRSLDIEFPYGDRYEDACWLYCLCAHVTRVGFLDQAYVHYVQKEGSITHNNNDQVKNMIDVFRIIVRYYKDHGFYDEYKEALEYIHIRFFLGNSFLRSARIKDAEDRRNTIMMGWNLLNETFPQWRKNHYLRTLPGMKNRYFRMVRGWNLMAFAWIFRNFKKDNL